MPEPATAAAVTAIAKEASPIVRGVLSTLAATLSKNIGKATRSVIDRTTVALQLGFTDYLDTSYNRCKYFKTILDPHQPQEVISHYVNVTLRCGNISLEDTQLIEDLDKYRHVVVTGLAGSGKSMFMKYLTLCTFEHPKESVPLFVELRHLNTLTDRDLLTYIRTSCTTKLHDVTPAQFDLSLHAGALLLILDGFDELRHEFRDQIQAQILAIAKDFPRTTIVISSRPDHRFGSWQSFHVFVVNPLTQRQTIKLIESLEYDAGVKRRFLREVRRRLYSSHQSFLSYPLLASIMLLTFEEFAEIPQKMHAFYGQAFDTLFQKHDAQKEQYQRQIKSGLSREDFKKCFSAFCALSYLDQKYSFGEKPLLSAGNNAVNYLKQSNYDPPPSLTAEAFIDDLFEAVCMLQPDGVETSFVHRSFQEYFAAVFATNLHGVSVKRFLDKCSTRFADSVLEMSLDMAQELVEKEWVLPAISEIQDSFWGPSAPRSISMKYALALNGMTLTNSRQGLIGNVRFIQAGLLGRIDGLCLLYPSRLPFSLFTRPFDSFSHRKFAGLILVAENEKRSGYRKLKRFLEPSPEGQPEGIRNMIVEFTEADDWWMDAIGAGRMFASLKRGLAAIDRDIRARDQKRANILDDFL